MINITSQGFVSEILKKIKDFTCKSLVLLWSLFDIHSTLNITTSHTIWLITDCSFFDQNKLAPTVGPWCSKSFEISYLHNQPYHLPQFLPLPPKTFHHLRLELLRKPQKHRRKHVSGHNPMTPGSSCANFEQWNICWVLSNLTLPKCACNPNKPWTYVFF